MVLDEITMAALSGGFWSYDLAHGYARDSWWRRACSIVWGGLARWPLATLLVLWPALGGHFVEIWFLNWLRPRLSNARGWQVAVRVGVWFLGGTALAIGMALTAIALAGFRPMHWPAWWLGGIAFIGLELVAHLVLKLRGRASFYNGLG